MIYKVRHITTVDYVGEVQLARFNLRLKPAFWPGQTISDYQLAITPSPWRVLSESGPWVVNRDRISIRQPLTELQVESAFRVEVVDAAANLAHADSPDVGTIRRDASLHRDLSATGPANYIHPSPMAPASAAITAWAAPMLGADTPIIAAGHALMAAIHREFAYDGLATTTETPPADAFASRRGVCQDFAHVMIVAARGHGIPAAYVSGYLRTIPPPGQERLVGVDATHAWAALWCGEQIGWIGFDPTNAMLASTDHIFTAMGRDYADVAPMDGVFFGGLGQNVAVSVDVAPVDEADEHKDDNDEQ